MAINDVQRIQIDQHYSRLANSERGQNVRKMIETSEAVKAAEGKLWLTHSVYNETKSVIPRLVSWYLWYEDQHGQAIASKALTDYLSQASVEMTVCIWVLGIKPSQRYEFDDVSVVPVAMMSDSRERDDYLALISNFSTPTAHGALTQTVNMPRVVSDNEVGNRSIREAINASYELLGDISLLINGLNGISCLPHWMCVYHSPDVPFGPFWPGGKGRKTFDVVGVHNRDLIDTQANLLHEMIRNYRHMATNPKTRKWFIAILERIRDSKRQQNIANKILDLGIAAEMLLLKDLGARDPISFPFRFRGSWLLGRDFAERERVHDSLKKFYGYRSQVAHNGSIEKPKDLNDVNERLPEFYRLVEETLQLALKPTYPKNSTEWLNLILGKDAEINNS